MNKAIIIGNLGQDPELTTSKGGMSICKFNLAESEKKKNGEQQKQWHRIVFFDKKAEVIAQYVQKGQKLYVEGRISYGKYEKADGSIIYTTNIIGHQFEFLTSKSDAEYQPRVNNEVMDNPKVKPDNEDDDVPF